MSTGSSRRAVRLPGPMPEPGRIAFFAPEGEDGLRVLVANVDGVLHAVEDRCSHAGISMEGAALAGCEIECPLHGARFDVRDGRAIALPARRAIRSFPIAPMADGSARVEVD